VPERQQGRPGGDARAVQEGFHLDEVDVRLAAEDLVVAHTRVSFEVEGRRVTDADVIAVLVFEDGKIVDAVEVNSPALNRFWPAGGDLRDHLHSPLHPRLTLPARARPRGRRSSPFGPATASAGIVGSRSSRRREPLVLNRSWVDATSGKPHRCRCGTGPADGEGTTWSWAASES